MRGIIIQSTELKHKETDYIQEDLEAVTWKDTTFIKICDFDTAIKFNAI